MEFKINAAVTPLIENLRYRLYDGGFIFDPVQDQAVTRGGLFCITAHQGFASVDTDDKGPLAMMFWAARGQFPNALVGGARIGGVTYIDPIIQVEDDTAARECANMMDVGFYYNVIDSGYDTLEFMRKYL